VQSLAFSSWLEMPFCSRGFSRSGAGSPPTPSARGPPLKVGSACDHGCSKSVIGVERLARTDIQLRAAEVVWDLSNAATSLTGNGQILGPITPPERPRPNFCARANALTSGPAAPVRRSSGRRRQRDRRRR
jgi:hypothetical protein